MTRLAYDLPRDESGRLIPYAWPGGYPILYLDGWSDTLCPDCANEAEAGAFEQSKPVAFFIHYEGAPAYCAECNRAIESAYGEVDES